MSDLESTIRSIAKAGRLNHLSLAATWDGKFEASYRGVATDDHRIKSHSDPATALLMALTGRNIDEPKKATRKRESKPAAAPAVDDEDDLL